MVLAEERYSPIGEGQAHRPALRFDALTTSGVCGGICGAMAPYIPYTIGEHTGGPTTLLCKVGWNTAFAQILIFQMIRAYALKDLFLVHNG